MPVSIGTRQRRSKIRSQRSPLCVGQITRCDGNHNELDDATGLSDMLFPRLWPSGGPAECIGKALAQGAGSFLQLLAATRDAPARVLAVVLRQGGERLGKGGPRLGLASLLWKGPRAW